MKLYKGFNADMTCRGFRYEEGNCGSAAAGENGIACCRGEKVKADTWYTLKNGRFAEVK